MSPCEHYNSYYQQGFPGIGVTVPITVGDAPQCFIDIRNGAVLAAIAAGVLIGDPYGIDWIAMQIILAALKAPISFFAALSLQPTIVYFDDNCQLVNPIDVIKECGADIGSTTVYLWFQSPISLVMSEGIEPEDRTSIARFPLDLDRREQFWIWKGSAETPLLVYDPDHTGKITSPMQLFGPWTFGGQQVASLADDMSRPHPWANGYEALGTLDRNGDTKLSGEELQALGLWFDRNQNGVSEEGEVVRLESADVDELYFKGYRLDERTRNIVLDVGYRRTVDGKSVVGKSVDWFTDGAADPSALLGKILLQNRGRSKAHVRGEVTSVSPAVSTPINSDAAAAPFRSDPFNGVWDWKIEGMKKRPNPDGTLMIRVNDLNNVDVVTVTELGLKTPNGVARSSVSFMNHKGRIGVRDGKRVLEFSRETPEEALSLQTIVELDSPGVLQGSTTIHYHENRRPREFRYTWRGEKVQFKQ